MLGCKKDSYQDPSDFGYSYQPSSLGHWVSYAVDSTVYSDVSTPSTITTYSYYLKEELDTTFLNDFGKESIRIIQYKKDSLQDPWQVYQVGTFQTDAVDFQRYFNDLRFVNLLFPIRDGKEWNGHIYLDVASQSSLEYLDPIKYNWLYHYTEVDVPKSIGGHNLDSCLTVVQIDEENLFEKKYSEEVYARNIGLVSKEFLILNTQAPPSSASFLDRAESGFVIKYTLIDYKH